MEPKRARSPRLYCPAELGAGLSVALSRDQAHYVHGVMRLGVGGHLRLFNGRDGEWLGTISAAGKRGGTAVCTQKLADAVAPPDIDYLFAPLKAARLDFIAQKATELGARRLRPVITARTIVTRVRIERLQANAVEAAEQCELVCVPEVLPQEPLGRVLDNWDAARRLIFCDEAGAGTSPLEVLQAMAPGPLAVLIGPEGGFTPQERRRLLALPFVTAVSLGPRIMRADTAAVAILALVQATLGDWA
jgi:16S rRNA (uracil1498-N3)-methyltransferase